MTATQKTTITLPAMLDSDAADDLEAMLAGDGPIALDASGVESLGGLCLEVIASAVAIRASGLDILRPSDAFEADLATFGLTPHDLAAGTFP